MQDGVLFSMQCEERGADVVQRSGGGGVVVIIIGSWCGGAATSSECTILANVGVRQPKAWHFRVWMDTNPCTQ